MSGTELLSDQGLRIDGRKPNELRRLDLLKVLSFSSVDWHTHNLFVQDSLLTWYFCSSWRISLFRTGQHKSPCCCLWSTWSRFTICPIYSWARVAKCFICHRFGDQNQRHCMTKHLSIVSTAQQLSAWERGNAGLEVIVRALRCQLIWRRHLQQP